MITDIEQKKLVAELAVAISQFMQIALPHDTDKDGFVSHSFQGPFDENCYVLAELGVARSSGTNIEQSQMMVVLSVGPGAYKFVPLDETRMIVMGVQKTEPSLLFRILESYLSTMVDYGWLGSHLSVGREPFEPAPIFRPQIDALVDCGYLMRSGTMVAWTDLIGPVMQAAHFWDSSSNLSGRPVIHLSIEMRADVERMIRNDQYIAAVAAVQKFAKAQLSEAKAYVDELKKFKRLQ